MRRRYFARSGRRSTGTRIFLGLLGTIVVLAAVVAGAMALYGPEIARRVIQAVAAHTGVPVERLEVRSIGFAGMTLGELRVGGPDGPAASAIEIGWTPLSLLRGRVGRVRVDGLTVNISIEDGAPVIAGLPRGEGGGMVALPVERIELKAAKVAVTADAARIDATIEATLEPRGDAIAGAATIDAIVKAGQADAMRVAARLPDWRLSGSEAGLQFAAVGADVAVPEHAVTMSAIDAQVTTGPNLSARLSGTVRDSATPARVVPLSVVAEAQGEAAQIRFKGRAASAKDEIVAAFDGRHARADGSGAITFELAPLRFAADGRQPAELFPLVGDVVRRVEGNVAARGTLSWGRTVASNGTLTLEHIGFEAGVARVSDLGGTIRLTSLLPPRTAPAQRIAASIHAAGLPPMPLEVRFALPALDRLTIDTATLGFAGGSLGLANTTLTLGKPVDAALTIHNVDLGAVFGLLDVDGLSGSGTIEGSIPVRVGTDGASLASGQLTGMVPGVLRYTGSGLPEPAADAPVNDPIRLMRAALADFHYTELKFTLERAVGGEGSLLINLKGANPQVLDNHPFAFNIRLDTNFDRIAAILLEGYAAAEALMRRGARP
jgi:hypothetical protein